MENNPLVTVIIPTFNREQRVGDAINSAIGQTYKNVQIIVIDDGSTDNTSQLLGNFPQVEYYYKPNGGQASARNAGLNYAKGSIVASLDSDDVWYPEYLEVCLSKLENDNLDFVFCNWDQDTVYGETLDFLQGDPFLKPYVSETRQAWITLESQQVRDLYIQSCPSPSSSVVLRRSSIVSGWDEEMNIGDDWCMYLEMILNKECKAAFTLDKLWHKRIDNINIYDGRKWSEVLEFLYIADVNHKLVKFKDLLTTKEKQILERRYMSGLVEFAKHNLIREKSIKQFFTLLKRSMNIDVLYTLNELPKVFLAGFRRKVGIDK